MPITEEIRKLIYEKLKKNLEMCSPPMVIKEDSSHHSYELIGNKPVPYGYNKKIIPGIFFAAIAHRKESVTFHFFPIYMNPKLYETAPTLTKYLKGKSCFHFKKLAQIDEKELNELLQKGIEEWQKAGYML
ncbi:MAG: hypothetical protein HW421_4093 [Ignavibacteria bacterium]|nr:hypothetical protein [Ignavibacteria bacterium]